MKKVLTFALIAMIAGVAGAQTLTWLGSSAVYDIDNTTWYNGSATWAGSGFDGTDFGLVSTLTLGAEVQTYTSPDGSYPGTATVTMGYEVDSLGAQALALPYLENTGNNEKWQDIATGVDVASGLSGGSHTVAVWFHAVDGAVDLYDNNGSANYVADFQTAAIPEPATMSLLGLGALAMALRRKMRK